MERNPLASSVRSLVALLGFLGYRGFLKPFLPVTGMTELELSEHLHGGAASHRGGWEGIVTVEGAREVSRTLAAPWTLTPLGVMCGMRAQNRGARWAQPASRLLAGGICTMS